jgi:vanillate O-demethylase ferredoxin subunit
MEAARELAHLASLAPSLRGVFAKRIEAVAVEDWEHRLWNRPPVLDDAPEWLDVTVDAVRNETETVKHFRLSLGDGAELPAFDPGAHIGVRLPDGSARHFSLCNLATDGGYEIAVSRAAEGRGGAKFLHEQIAPGARLTISRPRNSFPAILGAETHVLIAGGIGITPFLSMIRGFEQTGDRYELHYCARSADVAPFLELLRGQIGRNGKIHLHFSGGDPQARMPVEELLKAVDGGTHVYCCGPAGLMDAVHRATRHWPARRVHFESFVPPAAKGIADCHPFQVKIASSGRVLDVPADQSILDVLRQSGSAMPSSCESGTCGTCKVKYLGGTVEHRDYVLSPSEQMEFLTVCVSRATGDLLTLDL